MSRTVVDLVVGSDLHFVDRGEHEVKGLPGSWRVFAELEPDTHGQFKLTGHPATCWLPRARGGGAEVSGTNQISVTCQGGTAPGIIRNSFVQDHADQHTFVVGRPSLGFDTLGSDERDLGPFKRYDAREGA